MRVRLHPKPKPDNYTESCMIDVAGRWRERNVWYPGRSVRLCPERDNHCREAVLSAQKSAEAIVAEMRRTESTGVFSTTRKGGMSRWVQKTRKKAAHKEIVRNTKGM